MRTFIYIMILIVIGFGAMSVRGTQMDFVIPTNTAISTLVNTPVPMATMPQQSNTIIIEGDVIMGNLPPKSGVLCEDAPAFGYPKDVTNPPKTILSKGTTIEIREMGKRDNAGWILISIDPLYWIDAKHLCKR